MSATIPITPQHQDRQPGAQTQMTPQPDSVPLVAPSGKMARKIAFITGGDSGIGRAVALAFAKEGARVAIGYFDEHEDALETQRLIVEDGGECILIAGDVGSEAFCKEAIKTVIAEFGKLDVLVNNAAQQYPCENIEDISREQLEKTFRANIFSMFYM